MFCRMASGRAKPGKEPALPATAQEHARALLGRPGRVAAHVMTEEDIGTQLPMSMFRSEDEFNSVMGATMPVIAKHHLEELRDRPSTFWVLDVS